MESSKRSGIHTNDDQMKMSVYLLVDNKHWNVGPISTGVKDL